MAEHTDVYYDTLPPEAISAELQPIIDELDLAANCRELSAQGWTVLKGVASEAFNQRLRDTILSVTAGRPGANMLMARDPVFAEAVLMPKLMAMAEFSVGRGFLLSQVAASVRAAGSPVIGLHADHNWLPAPFPAHNMLLTACWACDGYTEAGGATLVIPGTHTLRRHPDAEEIRSLQDAVPIECEPGDVPIWDGNVWHSNYPRSLDGERVVCHITYTRLMMRQVEDYRAEADSLIDQYGEKMAQLLGQQDMLMSPNGADYSKLRATFNNAKR